MLKSLLNPNWLATSLAAGQFGQSSFTNTFNNISIPSRERCPIALCQLSQLSFVPRRYLGVVAYDPGDPVGVDRAAQRALLREPPAGPAAGVAHGELGAERHLRRVGVPEYLLHEIPDRCRRRLVLAEPYVDDRAGLDQRVEQALLLHALHIVDRGVGGQVNAVGVVVLVILQVALDHLAGLLGEVLHVELGEPVTAGLGGRLFQHDAYPELLRQSLADEVHVGYDLEPEPERLSRLVELSLIHI